MYQRNNGKYYLFAVEVHSVEGGSWWM